MLPLLSLLTTIWYQVCFKSSEFGTPLVPSRFVPTVHIVVQRWNCTFTVRVKLTLSEGLRNVLALGIAAKNT